MDRWNIFPVKQKGKKKLKGKNRVILAVLGLNKTMGKKEIIDNLIACSENKFSYMRLLKSLVKSFKPDDLIKPKFAFPCVLYRYINAANHIDRAFKAVRKRTNIIGCIKNNRSLAKIFFLVINFINQLFGNRSFELSLSITQY